MIGLDQEPTRETLDELDRILGAGTYAIAYAEDAAGIRAYVHTYERPPREWGSHFAPGLNAEGTLAVWRELTLRIDRIVNGESKPIDPPPEEKPPPGSEGPPLGGTDPDDPDLVIDNELPSERPPIGSTLPTLPEIDNELPDAPEPKRLDDVSGVVPPIEPFSSTEADVDDDDDEAGNTEEIDPDLER